MLGHCDPVTSVPIRFVLPISIPDPKEKENRFAHHKFCFGFHRKTLSPHFSAPLPNPQDRNGVRLPRPTHQRSSRRRRKRPSPPLPRPSGAAAQSRYYSTLRAIALMFYMDACLPQKRGIWGLLGCVPELAQIKLRQTPVNFGYRLVYYYKKNRFYLWPKSRQSH